MYRPAIFRKHIQQLTGTDLCIVYRGQFFNCPRVHLRMQQIRIMKSGACNLPTRISGSQSSNTCHESDSCNLPTRQIVKSRLDTCTFWGIRDHMQRI